MYRVDGWQLERKSTIIDEILDVSCNAMHDHYEDIREELDRIVRGARRTRNVNEFVVTLDSPQKREKMMTGLHLDVALMLYNSTARLTRT